VWLTDKKLRSAASQRFLFKRKIRLAAMLEDLRAYLISELESCRKIRPSRVDWTPDVNTER
jgi:hypothetical protein